MEKMSKIMDTFYNIHSEEKYCFIYEFIDYFNVECERNGIDYRLSVNDDNHMVINTNGEEVVTDLQVFEDICSLDNREVRLNRILKLNNVLEVKDEERNIVRRMDRCPGLLKFIEDIINKRKNIKTTESHTQYQVKNKYVGGFLESKNNLDNGVSLSFVYDLAYVYDNARIYEDATLRGNARAFNNACVYGKAMIRYDGMVYDDARVFNNAMTGKKVRIFGKSEVSSHVLGENIQIFGNIKINTSLAYHVLSRATKDTLQVFGGMKLGGADCKAFTKNLLSKTLPELINLSYLTGNYNFAPTVFNFYCNNDPYEELSGVQIQSVDGKNLSFLALKKDTDIKDVFLNTFYYKPKTTIRERLSKIIAEMREFDIMTRLIFNVKKYGNQYGVIGDFVKIFNVYTEDRRIYPEKWENRENNEAVFNALLERYFRVNILEDEKREVFEDLREYLNLYTMELFIIFLRILKVNRDLLMEKDGILIKEGVLIREGSHIYAPNGTTLEKGVKIRGDFVFPYNVTVNSSLTNNNKIGMVVGRNCPRSRIFLEYGKNRSINALARHAVFNGNRYMDGMEILPPEKLAETDTIKRYLGGVALRSEEFKPFKEDIKILARNYHLLKQMPWGKELLNKREKDQEFTWRERIEKYRAENHMNDKHIDRE